MARRSRIKKRGKNHVKKQTAAVETGAPKVAPAEGGADQSQSVQQSDFEKIVAESKATVGQSSAATAAPRRSRGRPRKPQPTAAASNHPQTEAPQGLAPQNPIAVEPAPDITQYLKGPILALSQIPAHKHKIPELAFSAAEAEACAASFNQILQAFVPDQNAMSPKTAAVVMGLLTFGGIGFTKLSIYSNAMEQRALERKIESAPPSNTEEPFPVETDSAPPPLGTTTAADFFSKRATL